MATQRIMGTEVEYGITVAGQPHANPMVAATRLVNAYSGQGASAGNARWDYEEEDPLRDARGFDVSRESADPSQLTDADTGMANLILTNGARFYVDHAHPEYSAPECTNPRDAVIWDKAGERIVQDACQRVAAQGHPEIVLYKNNTDGKGASYGTHENYLMDRKTPFGDIVTHLLPFFVSRQVICGAGRVGIGPEGKAAGFQISQRADFFEVEVGLETTLKRPIINTRDEPHADPARWRRLHVIVGDANLAEIPTYLKLGTTSIVLGMIEDGWITRDLAIGESVASLKAISHDPTLTHLLRRADGRTLTALELQWEYHDLAAAWLADRLGADVDPVTADVMARWASVLERLGRDPMLCAGELDWVAKLRLLESYRQRDGLEWDSARLQLIDLQYSDMRPERGLYHRLAARGQIERLVSDDEVAAATTSPPTDTRAYFRGRCLSMFPEAVAAASWDSVIFDLPGYTSLQRIPTNDPWRGTEEHVGELMEHSRDALALFRGLTG